MEMKKLRLTKKLLDVLVDDDFYETLHKKGWWINSHGYAVRQKRIQGKRKNTYLHHLVLPPKQGFDIDHINRNKLDNRRENLRYATRAENIYNMPEKKNNTSGHKGVSWDKQHKKWRAYIGGSVSRKELGLFSDFSVAVLARKKAEILYI